MFYKNIKSNTTTSFKNIAIKADYVTYWSGGKYCWWMIPGTEICP